MNILITAGGTQEKIDEVRYIANHSTGTLGAIIAETFVENPTVSVTYLHGASAIVPKHPSITSIPIFSTRDLETQLLQLLKQQTFDAVIHSMAVSDYTVENSISQDMLISSLITELESDTSINKKSISKDLLTKKFQEVFANTTSSTEKKISSDHQHLIMRLVKTPKIIEIIKKIQPETTLVGFKLLVDVTEEYLLDIAKKLLMKNNCDYVLANDLTNITGNKHKGLLLDKNNHVQTSETKQDIAKTIVATITKEKEGNQ